MRPVLDTSVVIDRVRDREPIHEDITAITLIEYPRIIYYKHFHGSVLFPTEKTYILAHKLQLKLLEKGTPQTASDLIIAAIAITTGQTLITKDKDFREIAEAAKKLKLKLSLKLLT